MKKLIIIFLLIPIAIGILSSCKKEDPKPNYGFSCKINGRFWTPRYQHWCPSCHAFVSSYYPNGARIYAPGTFDIKAILDTDERNEYIYIYIENLHKGNNVATFKRNSSDIFSNFNLEGACRKYHIDTSYENRFFVTKLDTTNHRIIGDFDLRAISFKCIPPDTIYMTEGKFDISPLWFK